MDHGVETTKSPYCRRHLMLPPAGGLVVYVEHYDTSVCLRMHTASLILNPVHSVISLIRRNSALEFIRLCAI